MKRDEARKMATAKMYDYGLIQRGWTVRFSRSRRKLGECHIDTRVIILSGPITDLSTRDQVMDTIIHEVAHAVTQSGHDRKWRAAVKAMGGVPERLTSLEGREPEARWHVFCPKHGRLSDKNRRPSGRMDCRRCGSEVTYQRNPNYR